jgi:hypothetical protein
MLSPSPSLCYDSPMHPLLAALLGALFGQALVLYILRLCGYRIALRRVGIPE